MFLTRAPLQDGRACSPGCVVTRSFNVRRAPAHAAPTSSSRGAAPIGAAGAPAAGTAGYPRSADGRRDLWRDIRAPVRRALEESALRRLSRAPRAQAVRAV